MAGISAKTIKQVREDPSSQLKDDLSKYLKYKKVKNVSTLNKKEMVETVRIITTKKKDVEKKATKKKIAFKKSDTKKVIIDKITNNFKKISSEKKLRKKELDELDRNGYKNPVFWNYKTFDIFKFFRISYAKIGRGTVNKMYRVMKNFMNTHNDYDLQRVIFYIGDLQTNTIKRYMTVSSEDINLRTLENFRESIDDILSGDVNAVGSDIVNEESEYIEYSRFDMILLKKDELNGKDSMYFFKTHGIDGGKKGNCVNQCIEKITGEKITDRKYSDLHELEKYCKDNKINLLLSTVKATEKMYCIKPENEIKIQNPDKPRRKIYLCPLIKENIIPLYKYKCEDAKGTILIDVENKHADVLINNKIEYNDIYIAGTKFYIKKDDKYELLKDFQKKDLIKDNMRIYQGEDEYNDVKVNKKGEKGSSNTIIPKIEIKHKYLFYDYETVCDFSEDNPIIPCSIQFFECSYNKYEYKEEKEKAILKGMTIDKVKIAYGKDCTKELLDVLANSEHTEYTLISYNGSKFDHYLLYDDLIKRIPDDISNVFFVKNMLLNFKIFNIHRLFDLYKHIPLSLRDACKGYGINNEKQKLNFYDIQKKYDTLEEDEFVKYLEDSEEYNKYSKTDVLCLAELMFKYKQTLSSIEIFEEYVPNICNILTYGGLMNNILNTHVREKNIILPTFDKNNIKYYKDLVRDRIGGRVELFNGVLKIDGKIISLDCSGLYPYVMGVLDVYYPCGKIIECKKISDMPADKIGFFYCSDIDQSKLKIKIVPEKTKKENDWKTTKKINNVLLSTVKIEMLKKYKVPFKTKNGFYFSERTKSCDMFTFILEMMKHKTEQDILKENKDEKYNPAKRQLIKNMMLILSGKLAEGLYLSKTSVMNCSEIREKRLLGKDVELKKIINNNNAIVKYDIPENDAIKNSKPVYLSTLIYDYSQQYMYENIYSQINHKESIYTDTDSDKITEKAFKIWLKKVGNKNVAHWEEVEEYDPRYKNCKMYAKTNKLKVVGSFIDEYKDKDFNCGYFLKKKGYYMTGNDKELKFAGVQLKDIYLKDVDTIKDMNEKELNDYYNTTNTIESNLDEFIKDLYDNKEVYILSQSMTKNINKISINLVTNKKKITI
jgi:hypothetical protein